MPIIRFRARRNDVVPEGWGEYRLVPAEAVHEHDLVLRVETTNPHEIDFLPTSAIRTLLELHPGNAELEAALAARHQALTITRIRTNGK